MTESKMKQFYVLRDTSGDGNTFLKYRGYGGRPRVGLIDAERYEEPRHARCSLSKSNDRGNKQIVVSRVVHQEILVLHEDSK